MTEHAYPPPLTADGVIRVAEKLRAAFRTVASTVRGERVTVETLARRCAPAKWDAFAPVLGLAVIVDEGVPAGELHICNADGLLLAIVRM